MIFTSESTVHPNLCVGHYVVQLAWILCLKRSAFNLNIKHKPSSPLLGLNELYRIKSFPEGYADSVFILSSHCRCHCLFSKPPHSRIPLIYLHLLYCHYSLYHQSHKLKLFICRLYTRTPPLTHLQSRAIISISVYGIIHSIKFF